MTSIIRYILKTDSRTAGFLSDYIASSGFKDICDVESDESYAGQLWIDAQRFVLPVRLGKILNILAREKQNIPRNLKFIQGTLDLEDSSFSVSGGSNKIRLTEKEVAILVYLHDRRGQTVSRAALLSAVWDYAQAVETHTLETHIYRLRQKIETDPSAPIILLTDIDGYKVL